MNNLKVNERLEGIKNSNLHNDVKNDIHDFFYKLHNKIKPQPKYSAKEWVDLENHEKAKLFDDRHRKLRSWHDVVAVSEFNNDRIKTYIQNFLNASSISYAHRRDHYII